MNGMDRKQKASIYIHPLYTLLCLALSTSHTLPPHLPVNTHGLLQLFKTSSPNDNNTGPGKEQFEW